MFTVSLHGLPISGADVVLKVEWLKNLGLIITYYTTLTMQFTHLDLLVELCADVASHVTSPDPIHPSSSSLVTASCA